MQRIYWTALQYSPISKLCSQHFYKFLFAAFCSFTDKLKNQNKLLAATFTWQSSQSAPPCNALEDVSLVGSGVPVTSVPWSRTWCGTGRSSCAPCLCTGPPCTVGTGAWSAAGASSCCTWRSAAWCMARGSARDPRATSHRHPLGPLERLKQGGAASDTHVITAQP